MNASREIFDDQRWRASEGLVEEARRAEAEGDGFSASKLYRDAALLAESFALDVPSGLPKTRSTAGVSAAELARLSGDAALSEAIARRLLADTSSLTDEGAAELRVYTLRLPQGIVSPRYRAVQIVSGCLGALRTLCLGGLLGALALGYQRGHGPLLPWRVGALGGALAFHLLVLGCRRWTRAQFSAPRRPDAHAARPSS